MQALVLEQVGVLRIREIEIDETMGPGDVRVAIRNVGICGSDVHYYEHGAIGSFVVRRPMVLGHEAAGTVVEVGAGVAHLQPGDVAVIIGAGTIGMMTALAALAGGCSQIIISDVVQPKLDLAAALGPITPVNASREDLGEVVNGITGGWGADIVFEASGNAQAAAGVFQLICPGGRVVLIGMPGGPIQYDVVAAQIKEARVEHIFRYAHVYPRALALMGSAKIDVKPMLTDLFPFEQGLQAIEFARHMPPTSVKAQIELP